MSQQRTTGRTNTTGRASGRLSGRLHPTTYTSPFPVPLKSIPVGLGGSLPDPSGGPLTPVPATGLARARQTVRLDTLAGQFNALAGLSILLALVMMTTTAISLGDLSNEFEQVSANSAPSVAGASDLSRQLNDLDTHAADLLITSYLADKNPTLAARITEKPQAALTGYTTSRQNFNNTLLKAYANVTFRNEAPTLRDVANEFEQYVSQIGVMQAEIMNKHYEAALAAYKHAHDIVIGNPTHAIINANGGMTDEEVLKSKGWPNFNTETSYKGLEANVHRLYQINQTQLDNSYHAGVGKLGLNRFMIILAGLLLLTALAALALRYALVTHRVVNPGYMLALVGSLVMLLVLWIALGSADKDFDAIAHDSFLSIDAAGQAQQVLRDFNGDESRLLMSPALLGLNTDDPTLTPEVKQGFDANLLLRNFSYKKNQIEQQVKSAWANVTYPEENLQLCKVEKSPNGAYCGNSAFGLTDYFTQHDQIVQAYNHQQLDQALLISYGASNNAADKAEQGLIGLGDVNKQHFDIAACASIGESQFNNICSSAKTKQGDIVEEAGFTPLKNDQNGYLPFLQWFSLAIFAILAAATAGGAWLARRLF